MSSMAIGNQGAVVIQVITWCMTLCEDGANITHHRRGTGSVCTINRLKVHIKCASH